MQPENYQDNFFEYHLQGAISSAENVIPVVKEYIDPASVIDIGCGIGAWLSVWKKSGVKEIMGVDGEYVDTSKLLIEQDEFKPFNLERAFTLDKKYELVTSLEVAEHIPAKYARVFVESLCSLGNVILFSAAIPAQEGTMHVNEQYPDYWVNIFAENGFIPVDCLRKKIWNNKNIQWWYRQNMLLFVNKDMLANYPTLNELAIHSDEKVLSLIHPEMVQGKVKKIDYYESILNSNKATLKYFIENKLKGKK
jgi:hypothetical protein